MSTITSDRFATGLTYELYKKQMTRNRERFEANEAAAPVGAAELEAFRALPAPLNVLVLAEDWCGDVIQNLPILGRIAAETGKLRLRVFLRDENPDLMEQFLNNGHRSIPVFAFFDDAFRELGRFTERPATVTARRSRRRSEVYASRPEFGAPDEPVAALPENVRIELTERLAAARAVDKPWEDTEVVRELREIVLSAVQRHER